MSINDLAPAPGVRTTPAPVGLRIRRIAAVVDDSDAGRAALSWASAEAAAFGARLTLCHVRAGSCDGKDPPRLITLVRTEPCLAPGIRWWRRRVNSLGVVVGRPAADAAAALTAGRRCDLIVVGAPGPGDTWHWPTAPRFVAQAACPLVVVRADAGAGGGPFAGHVVVAVDATPAAAAGLRFGFAYAFQHQLPLAAVHVDAGHADDYWFDDTFLETYFVTEPPGLQLLGRQVEPVAAGYRTVPVKRAVFGRGVLPGLRRAAAGAALLVITRHGPGAVLHTGSVSCAFAERAACPVAIVPEPAGAAA